MRRSIVSHLSRSFIIVILSLFLIYSSTTGQPSLSFDLKKPSKFENKTLASEKTGNKKFTVPRRFVQNTFTHYNYYFNANNRLNEIVARAKAANRDDYTQLLPFYNYSLQTTAGFKTDLDSVIYKSTAGVLIHDLRNDWIDNLYLLIGRAYYLRNQLDSAYLTFQYINYTFSPKEKDGYDKVIGTNEEGVSNVFSISTKEKSNIVKRVFSEQPSRNESLVWQIRTYLAANELPEAAGLIETLKHDPFFPTRLRSEFEEVQALWFYKQEAYDSSAAHLEKALGNAEDNQEKARWEYLIAQMYERVGNYMAARQFYDKAVRHSLDPVLEVYARLNSIRQDKNGTEKDIQNAIDALVDMARKDRYVLYRDIIYYNAAVIETERKNPEGAKNLLLKSIKYSTNNSAQKSRSFLALGDLTFNQKRYTEAKNYYDSVDVQAVGNVNAKLFNSKKDALGIIVIQTSILERQDSLLRIAAMPATEREAFIKKLVKQLRKQQGLKEDDAGVIAKGNFAGKDAAPDLFGAASPKDEWYFSNASLKGKGYSEFRSKWGNRPNTDNWRRQAVVSKALALQAQSMHAGVKVTEIPKPVEANYDALVNNLPLTPEKQKISADSTEQALFSLGKAYMNGLEDYLSAIDAFEKLLADFPATSHSEESWYNLYYCYNKTRNIAGQAKVKQALASKFPNGKLTALLNTKHMSQSPDSLLKMKATGLYQDIYNLFIEGNFDEALSRKKQADSLYGQVYWSPQLLYIEAVYYIRQRNDSVAQKILAKSMQLYPSSPMFAKTSNLMRILARRKEIEDYLTKLDIERPLDDAVVKGNDNTLKQGAVITPKPIEIKPDTSNKSLPAKDVNSAIVKNNSNLPDVAKPEIGNKIMAMKSDLQISAKLDSLRMANNAETERIAKRADSLRAANTADSLLALHKADSLRIANKEESLRLANKVDSLRFAKKTDSLRKAGIADSLRFARKSDSLRMANKADSLRLAKQSDSLRLASRADSLRLAKKTDSLRLAERADSLRMANRPRISNALYSENPAEPHYAVLVLNKVDPVYATEARNAFNRYHRETYGNNKIDITTLSLNDDIKLILLNNLENANAALDYISKTKKVSQTEIIPWLTPQKYSFVMITGSNLEILKNTKDLTAYTSFLKQLYPAIF